MIIIRCFRYFLLFAILVLIGSCSRDYDKLKGKWSASGEMGDTTDLHSWYIEYEFDGMNYTKTGYPPLREEGKVEIIEERGDSLKFLFYVLKSDPEQKSYEEWLVLKENKLHIGGLELSRSIPGSSSQ